MFTQEILTAARIDLSDRIVDEIHAGAGRVTAHECFSYVDKWISGRTGTRSYISRLDALNAPEEVYEFERGFIDGTPDWEGEKKDFDIEGVAGVYQYGQFYASKRYVEHGWFLVLDDGQHVAKITKWEVKRLMKVLAARETTTAAA